MVKAPVVKAGLWDSTICFSQHSAWVIDPQEQLKAVLLVKNVLPQTLQFMADHLLPFYKLYSPADMLLLGYSPLFSRYPFLILSGSSTLQGENPKKSVLERGKVLWVMS